MSGKGDFWKGYADGQKDAAQGVTPTGQILTEALIPGTLPSEKGDAYKAGYDSGKADGKK